MIEERCYIRPDKAGAETCDVWAARWGMGNNAGQLHGWFELGTTALSEPHSLFSEIVQIKSPYYHRVLNPSDAPCSNEYFLPQSYPVLPSLVPPFIKMSERRINYLEHILRHPQSPESLITFNPSHSLRTISSNFRCGAPRAHWPKLALPEAYFLSSFNVDNPLPTPVNFSTHFYPFHHR